MWLRFVMEKQRGAIEAELYLVAELGEEGEYLGKLDLSLELAQAVAIAKADSSESTLGVLVEVK